MYFLRKSSKGVVPFSREFQSKPLLATVTPLGELSISDGLKTPTRRSMLMCFATGPSADLRSNCLGVHEKS